MLWSEFLAWLEALKRRREGPELTPDSWQGYEGSQWYQDERRKRDEERRQRYQ